MGNGHGDLPRVPISHCHCVIVWRRGGARSDVNSSTPAPVSGPNTGGEDEVRASLKGTVHVTVYEARLQSAAVGSLSTTVSCPPANPESSGIIDGG